MYPSRSVLGFPIRTEFILLLALGLLPWAAGTQTCSEVAQRVVCNFDLMGEGCSVNLTSHSCSGGIRLSVNESNSQDCVWTGKADDSSARQMSFGHKDPHSWDNIITSDILMQANLTFIVSCLYGRRGVVVSITFFLFSDDDPLHPTQPLQPSPVVSPSEAPPTISDVTPDMIRPTTDGNSTSALIAAGSTTTIVAAFTVMLLVPALY